MASISKFLSGACARHSKPPTRIYVKLNYISSSLPQTGCLGKICEPRYLSPKLAKTAIFSIFSNLTVDLFNVVEEIFRLQKDRAHQPPFLIFRNFAAIIFRVFAKKKNR